MAIISRTLTPERALQRLAAICAKREICQYDARQRLYRWGLEPDEHDGIIQQLVEKGFIDDQRFAEMFVKEKSSLNHWGPHKLQQELRRRGIHPQQVQHLFDDNDKDDMRNTLCGLLQRKLQTLHDTDAYQCKQKLIRYAISKGYAYDDIIQCLPREANTD